MYKRIIFSISFILFVFISYKIYRDYNEANVKKEVVKNQILNIENINILNSINILVKKYRGLLQLEDIKTKVSKSKQLLQTAKSINRLLNTIDDIKLKNKIVNILITDFVNKEESFFEYTQIINLINFRIITISSQNELLSQLNHEKSNQIYSMVHYIPQMVENIAKVRGIGSNIITRNSIDDSQKYKIKENINSFSIYFEKLDEQPQIIKEILSNFEDLKLILDDIYNAQFNIGATKHFQKSSKIIKLLDNYYMNIEKDLKEHLESSIQDLDEEMSLMIFELLVGMLIIITLSVYVHNKVETIEKQKRKINYEVKMINELYKHLYTGHSVKEQAEISIKFLSEKLSSSTGVLYMIDRKNEQLNLAATYNISKDDVKNFINYDDGIFADAIKTKTIKTIEEDSRFEVSFGGFKTHISKVLVIPIISSDNIVMGVIQLSFINNRELEPFIDNMFTIIADNLFKAQKNEENEKYFNLIDKYVITSTTNKDGVINYASEAFCNVSGYNKSELVGNTHSLLKHDDVEDKVYKNLWNTVTSGKTWSYELPNRKKDGSTYWVKAIVFPEFGFYGDIIGYNSIRVDTTDKKIIEQISITDSLTNLYNRRYFDEIFLQQINIAKRDSENGIENKFLGFLIIDIDHFKQYNDTYGHHKGDVALKQVSTILQETFRRPDDYVFRLGGEEFGVLLFANTKPKLCEMANQLIKNVEQKEIIHETNSISDFLTISAGMYVLDNNQENGVKEVYEKSDKLLYKAKKDGRNRACYLIA